MAERKESEMTENVKKTDVKLKRKRKNNEGSERQDTETLRG